MTGSAYESVSVEEFLDYQGIEYRPTAGSRGPQFNIRECPVCGGSSWKVYLSQDTGLGNCFHGSCESRFNMWTFARAHLDDAEPSVVYQLFEEIAKVGGWRPKFKKGRASAPQLPDTIKLPTSFAIPANNIPYLEARGIPAHVAGRFGLRMCLDGAYRYRNQDGQDRAQVYSGRLIIPIHDLDGKLVTFQGRDTTGRLDPKYLFPPMLPSTARFLYNGHRALAESWEHLVLNEGAMDVICTQMAIDETLDLPRTGAAGTFGKKLTLDGSGDSATQLQSLLRLKENGLRRITILWDGEKSALTAAIQAAGRLRGYGFEAFIALLPPGKDPAEVSPSVVRASIQRAIPYSSSLAIKARLKNPYT